MSDQARLGIYIDGRNIWHGCEAVGIPQDVDPWKLGALVVPGARIQQVNYYDCPLDQTKSPAEYADQRRFIAYLRSRPDAQVRLGRRGRRAGGQVVHKGVDTELTTDIIVGAFNDQYDIALVVSADGDFADPIYAVRGLGKTAICTYVKRPKQPLTAPLAKAADSVRVLALPDVAYLVWPQSVPAPLGPTSTV